jgi:hypothetical protein
MRRSLASVARSAGLSSISAMSGALVDNRYQQEASPILAQTDRPALLQSVTCLSDGRVPGAGSSSFRLVEVVQSKRIIQSNNVTWSPGKALCGVTDQAPRNPLFGCDLG